MHVLERELLVPAPRERVFPFFADAHNLERITPPALRFRILTPGAIEMRPGAVIDYRLSLAGVPFRWRTVIEAWDPPNQFVDLQTRGPYKLWRHTHTFADAPGGTLMRDRVEYELPLGPLGALARRLFVARQLDGIFRYRQQVIADVFGGGGGGGGGQR
jgi:ligand-binding SRPBCC domain-containing protein